MSAQVKYRNNVSLNYSLTTYSPIEGWRVAFNGTDGRIEAMLDIPYHEYISADQAELHAKEMEQSGNDDIHPEQIIVQNLWEDYKIIDVSMERNC